ncbi:unnamed protein product, partial [Cyprideis torosa]
MPIRNDSWWPVRSDTWWLFLNLFIACMGFLCSVIGICWGIFVFVDFLEFDCWEFVYKYHYRTCSLRIWLWFLFSMVALFLWICHMGSSFMVFDGARTREWNAMRAFVPTGLLASLFSILAWIGSPYSSAIIFCAAIITLICVVLVLIPWNPTSGVVVAVVFVRGPKGSGFVCWDWATLKEDWATLKEDWAADGEAEVLQEELGTVHYCKLGNE